MTLPRLADVDPALLTRIGARAMDALKEYGWLESRPPERTRVTAERATRPKRKHVRTTAAHERQKDDE